ncbi:MAG TPA: cupin domain-containing protein [Actinomycetota bacterium]|nr:cupin domain-containing protein [Actinomycetota bacterium]
MGEAATKRFDQPDDTRSFDHGKIEMIHLAGASAARATFEPGWRWSVDLKPVMGTDLCMAHHIGYVLEGGLHVVPEGGAEFEVGPGDAYEIMPGHDAWVTGDATYVALEFQSETAERWVAK